MQGLKRVPLALNKMVEREMPACLLTPTASQAGLQRYFCRNDDSSLLKYWCNIILLNVEGGMLGALMEVVMATIDYTVTVMPFLHISKKTGPRARASTTWVCLFAF